MYQRLSNLLQSCEKYVLVATTLCLEEELIIYEREHTSDGIQLHVYVRQLCKIIKHVC